MWNIYNIKKLGVGENQKIHESHPKKNKFQESSNELIKI